MQNTTIPQAIINPAVYEQKTKNTDNSPQKNNSVFESFLSFKKSIISKTIIEKKASSIYCLKYICWRIHHSEKPNINDDAIIPNLFFIILNARIINKRNEIKENK